MKIFEIEKENSKTGKITSEKLKVKDALDLIRMTAASLSITSSGRYVDVSGKIPIFLLFVF